MKTLITLTLFLTFSVNADISGDLVFQGYLVKRYISKKFVSIENDSGTVHLLPKEKVKITNKKRGRAVAHISPADFLKFQKKCKKEVKGENKKLCPSF
jgi:hypothetical protein